MFAFGEAVDATHGRNPRFHAGSQGRIDPRASHVLTISVRWSFDALVALAMALAMAPSLAPLRATKPIDVEATIG